MSSKCSDSSSSTYKNVYIVGMQANYTVPVRTTVFLKINPPLSDM